MKIQLAKDLYFDNIGAYDHTNRDRIAVYRRAAFVNAHYHLASKVSLGKLFGKDHATVIHAHKMHDSYMIYPEYQELYEEAVKVREHIFCEEDEPVETRLRKEITSLENTLKELYHYKDKFYELKQLVDGS